MAIREGDQRYPGGSTVNWVENPTPKRGDSWRKKIKDSSETTPLSSPSTNHKHRWRIEEPNGPTSDGYCPGCDKHRTFRNSDPEIDFTTRLERKII